MKKINRKDLLKIGAGAAVGGLFGYVFSGGPRKGLQFLVELTQNQYVLGNGQENYLKAVCSACGNKCLMTVRITWK